MRGAALEAARAEVRERGPAALSIRAVARRAGLPVTSLYRHFTDRADLMDSLAELSYAELGADFSAAYSASTDPEDEFRALARALWFWARRRPEEFALLYGCDPHATGLRNEAVIATRAGAVDQVTSAVARIVESHRPGQEPDPTSPEVISVTMSGWFALVGFVAFVPRLPASLGDPQDLYADHVERVLTMVRRNAPSEG